MFGNLGFTELLVIFGVILLFFGARRLPEIGSSLGKGIREFKRSISEVGDAVSTPPEPRTGTGDRQIDGTDQKETTGEPKRLSQ